MAFLRVLRGKRIVNGSSVLLYLVVYFFQWTKETAWEILLHHYQRPTVKEANRLLRKNALLR